MLLFLIWYALRVFGAVSAHVLRAAAPVELTTWRSPSALTFRLPPSSVSAARPLDHVLRERTTIPALFSLIFSFVCFAHGFRLFVVGAARRRARSDPSDTDELFTSTSTHLLLIHDILVAARHLRYSILPQFWKSAQAMSIWILVRRAE